MNVEAPWTVYRTRFLVHARQLTEPLVFTDALGREHSGRPGDYLMESSDGLRRITPRHLFEDIYVPVHASLDAALPPRSACRDRAARGTAPKASQSASAAAWSA
jgi:hypothetical protein